MTTHTTDPNELLDVMTAAAREDVADTELDAAVRRFRDRLPASAPAGADATRTRRLPRWLGLAGALATLVLAVTILPLLLPGKVTGSGFAQAQAWFADYRTLQLTLVTRQGTMELYRMTVWHERGGATRIELGPMTQIVDPIQGVMMQLGADGRLISRQPLWPRASDHDGRPDLTGLEREELAWLDELRDFRGQAQPIDAPRAIDGTDARGWRLELSGTSHTLWVDPADFRPLLLEGELGAGVTMATRFVFDVPLPDDLFIPTPGVTAPNNDGR